MTNQNCGEFGKGEAMSMTNQGDRSLANDEQLYEEIKHLIERSRTQVVAQVNQTLVLTYWHIGKIIKTEVLQADRAQYGEPMLKQLAVRLRQDYGTGFSYSSLTHMAKFYSALPDREIVATLSQQLSWSHFVELIRVEDDLKREFYVTMCANERWSVRVLRDRLNGMLFERTAIAKQPEEVIRRELEQLAQRQPISGTISMWRSIGCSCRQRRCCKGSYGWRSPRHRRGWRFGERIIE